MRRFAVILIAPFILLVHLTACAAVVAGVVGVLGRPHVWQWYQWVIVAPGLYLAWLILLLAESAMFCHLVWARHPKPRYVSTGTRRLDKAKSKQLAAISRSYIFLAFLEQLPLMHALRGMTGFSTLFFRAYSPSVHIGKDVQNFGLLWDPDITDVGDHVIIGANATIVGHSFTSRKNGSQVYVSAPVTIGPRATIGGLAVITMGCTIGADAVIENSAVLTPFTTVPAGEVWAGNPARPVRTRDEPASETDPPQEAVPEPVVARPAPAVVSAGESGARRAPSIEEIRHLIVEALLINDNDAAAELSADTCAEWDSMGQVAIAAALFDRFGIAVRPERLFTLRTLADIEAVFAISEAVDAAGLTVSAAGSPGAAVPDARASRTDELPEDVEMLPLMDSQAATRELAARFDGLPVAGSRLRLVIASTFTAQPIASAIRLWGRAFGFEIECQFADYGQIVQALLDPAGAFATNANGVNVILARPEDVVSSPATSFTRADDLLDALESFTATARSGAQLLVGSLPPVVSSSSVLPPDAVEALRARWRQRLQSLAEVDVLEFATVVERLGVEQARSSASEALTRGPYSPRLYQDLGIAIVRRIRAARRAPAKVIAVDCDNTLWGGILGEAEPEGLELGPDGRGRSFQIFQQYLKELKDRGLLIVVVSRNEERDVRQVFERHPGMMLRPGDVAAWRVNWKFKSENLRDLADTLGLGLDAFVLLDDDPAVRAEVATRLPEVHVVPLGVDPSSFCDTLARLWVFDGAQRTDVDAARTRMMQEEDRRAQERRQAGSLETYLAALQLSVEVATIADEEWPRIVQLTQKTNQFNLSLRRRALPQLRAIEPESCVLAVKARDRFGDYGLVGVAIIQRGQPAETWVLDTFLLSCRALGRGVDDAFLHGVALVAVRRGARLLMAPYVEGPRNGQVRDFLARCGFTETTANVWRRPLASLPDLPRHVRFELSDDVEASDRVGPASRLKADLTTPNMTIT